MPPSGNVAAKLPTVDPVPTDNDIVNLSAQGLQAKGNDLAKSTTESAQSFMTAIAKRLFGEDTGISKVAYNMTSFASSSSTSSSRTESSGPEGATLTSSFNMSQSASFTGTGQITTDDGRVFDFELSVKYEASVETTTTEPLSNGPKAMAAPDELVLTGKPLPAIKFPGSLDDLFKMLSRELRTEVSGANGEGGGDLTLRLMRLVDRAALLAPRVRPDDPEATPTERAKALASSYVNAPDLNSLPGA
ncbi:MAG: hypothetical protein V4631_12200 [Pseudomonadota bacterium]